ncbi:MAG: DUF3823 domain-containing protein [Prolixibacteraceae bacterium]|jgi:hypothetical protein
MKLKLIIAISVIGAFLASCGKDNFDEPGSKLEGKLVYNGEAINVSYNDVTMQLWEPGWQTKGEITVSVNQDGTFGAMLFNSTYKLIIPSNQGPFRSKTNTETGSDTILVKLDGSKVMDIEVEPYYMIRTPQFTASGVNVTGTFKVEQIISGTNAKDIERVNLYVNKTQFVDFRSNVNKTYNQEEGEVDPSVLDGALVIVGSTITLNAVINPIITPTQNYVFARIGLKISGVEDMIFSPVVKVNL